MPFVRCALCVFLSLVEEWKGALATLVCPDSQGYYRNNQMNKSHDYYGNNQTNKFHDYYGNNQTDKANCGRTCSLKRNICREVHAVRNHVHTYRS